MSAPAARVFLSYADQDDKLHQALSSHLAPLLRQGVIATWHHRMIPPGSERAEEIDRELESADLILLLVSPDFVASDYCYQVEMERAMARHRAGEAIVIPVILRPCDWQACPFARLTPLPADGRAATIQENLDQALFDVAAGVRSAVAELGKRRSDALYGYLRGLMEETAYLNIRGIAPSAANVRGALRQPIEALYTPLRCRGDFGRDLRAGALSEGIEPMGEALAGGLVELPELLTHHPFLLIEGQPGAGKTTFLNLIACALARDALGEPCPEGDSWRRHIGLDDREPPTIPILLRLADLVPLFERAPSVRRDDRRWLLELLKQLCEENGYSVTRDRWREMLEGGEALLLLDGLDEVATRGLRERLFAVFRDACEHWRCPLVVASRPIQTAALVDMGFRVAVIEPFSDREIRAFVDRWVAALHGAASADAMDRAAERYRDLLLEAIVTVPRVRRLATNPVMLTCLCVVHWNQGRLPEGRARVYRAVIEWLIAARRDQRAARGFHDRFAWRALARLALAMIGAEGGKRTAFDLEDGAVAIEPVVARSFSGLDPEERRYRGREWLRFECLGSGIVEEIAGRRARFWHLTFGEYLAALQLAWRADGEDDEQEDWWPVIKDHLGDAQWRETLELFPVCLFDEGGEGRVDKLLGRVQALRGAAPDLATEARVAAVVARLLEPLAAVGYEPRPELAEVHAQALERSMAVFTAEGAAEVPVADRIAVAEALGKGGDPRFASGREHFIEVPRCDGWRLGKYPVTVEEYQRFVDHRGYEEANHWSTEGWALRDKKGWETPGSWEQQLQTPNRPVVEVSWYEAEAYCRWLSEQRGGQEVRLPSEEEWQRAASPDGRTYPWGEEDPDPERANFAKKIGEGHVGSPTPVGIYPSGDGHEGHCDLAGNVWEWCRDEVPASSPIVAMGAGKVLRGGGWHGPAGDLRATERSRLPAGGRGDVIGFRLAVAPAST